MAEHGFETRDLQGKPLLQVVCALVGAAVSIHFAMSGVFGMLKAGSASAEPRAVDDRIAAQRERPPEPRLQKDAQAEYDAYFREQRHRLESYGWIDRPAGIAHIPVARAMELLAHGK